MDKILFSIIIPTYNYADRLKTALESILQDQENAYEIIVVDDGSTDHTEAVIQAYQAINPNRSIIYYQQPNQGPASARNQGIRLSQGEYIILLDADDSLLPNALMSLRDFIQKNTVIPLIICDYQVKNESGKIKTYQIPPLANTKEKRVCQYLHKKLPMNHGALVFHHDVFKKLKYPETLKPCEDIPLFIQALSLFDVCHLPHPMAIIHKHTDSLRHTMPQDENFAEKLTGATFDAKILPPEMMRFHSYFLARRYLSLFRLYLHGQKPITALKYYGKSLQVRPFIGIHPRYWSKLVRTIWLILIQSFQGKRK